MGESPDVWDANDEPIELGAKLKYLKTGTLGKAAEIMEDGEGVWVLLDTTNLYYKPETLILTTEEATIEHEKEATTKDVKEYLKHLEEEAEAHDLNAVRQFTGGG
ncbi:DUF2098 family protein [Methanohalophilus sp.]|uniref:DUF2098 domain-containing protein n=1 Tax=Methanohalophilus sp. TaxID=1966352 RepID=UPI00262E5BC0|nr:DUF2098 family protein [Methanohalophilus sp.]MDK2892773.1 hypothetical protein [Methanohalophilus sp.]